MEFEPLADPRLILGHMMQQQDKQRKANETFSNGQTALRGQLPQWGPGEFDEWKQAKMTGTPTEHGAMKQRLYNYGRMGLPQMGMQYQRAYNEGIQRQAAEVPDFLRRHGRLPRNLSPAVQALIGLK